MKTTQKYVRHEKTVILAARTADIRGRWHWGLRLLRDPEAFSAGSAQLRPGVSAALAAAYKSAGIALSDREIRNRLQAARAYPTEAQIRQVAAEFPHWTALVDAGFPAYPAPDDEPPADHRTDAERRRNHARALTEQMGEQGAFYPLSDFEPVTTTLKELEDYTRQQDELTERFAEHGRKRRAYLDALIVAADGDLSVTWQTAHDLAGMDDEVAP